jgi:hypothetical protein
MEMGKRFSISDWNDHNENYVGVTCWWSVSEGAWPVDDVRAQLEANGFDGNLVKDPTFRKAFSRAARSLNSGREGRFARGIKDDSDRKVVGVVSEHVDQDDESLEYVQTTTASLTKQDGSIEVKGALGTEFREGYDKYRVSFTNDDIRSLIRKVIADVGGVPLRATGGVYFIPRPNVERMDALNSVMTKLGAGTIYLMRVPDSADGSERAIAWECAEAEIEGRIAKITDAVDRIDKRAKCMAKQKDRLVEVRRIMAIYVGLCEEEARAEAIREKFSVVESAIAKKLGILKKKAAEAKAEKEKAEEDKPKRKARKAKKVTKEQKEAALRRVRREAEAEAATV